MNARAKWIFSILFIVGEQIQCAGSSGDSPLLLPPLLRKEMKSGGAPFSLQSVAAANGSSACGV
jgi:hypothetical protein